LFMKTSRMGWKLAKARSRKGRGEDKKPRKSVALAIQRVTIREAHATCLQRRRLIVTQIQNGPTSITINLNP